MSFNLYCNCYQIKRESSFDEIFEYCVCISCSASLVPMFAFGENDIYEQLSNPQGSWLRRVQDAVLTRKGIPLALIMGRGVFQYSLGIVPYRKPIYLVGGLGAG